MQPVPRSTDPTATPSGASGDVVGSPEAPVVADRRQSGRRSRARDRLLDRGVQATSVPRGELQRVRDIENMLLFIDDDLRETALAMTRIEDFLGRTLQTLESPTIKREHVSALAGDTRVLDHLDQLAETLESLRRRLGKLSSTMR
jgi:hypothetical protein